MTSTPYPTRQPAVPKLNVKPIVVQRSQSQTSGSTGLLPGNKNDLQHGGALDLLVRYASVIVVMNSFFY